MHSDINWCLSIFDEGLPQVELSFGLIQNCRNKQILTPAGSNRTKFYVQDTYRKIWYSSDLWGHNYITGCCSAIFKFFNRNKITAFYSPKLHISGGMNIQLNKKKYLWSPSIMQCGESSEIFSHYYIYLVHLKRVLWVLANIKLTCPKWCSRILFFDAKQCWPTFLTSVNIGSGGVEWV